MGNKTITKKDSDDIKPYIHDLTTHLPFLFFQFSLNNFPKIIIDNNRQKPSKGEYEKSKNIKKHI